MDKKDLLIIPAIALVLGVYYYMFIKLKPYITDVSSPVSFRDLIKPKAKGTFGDVNPSPTVVAVKESPDSAQQ